MASKRTSKTKPDLSPLDAKRRELLENERKIQLEIERRERLIKDAPKLKEEKLKKRREELLVRKSKLDPGVPSSHTLPDNRFVFGATTNFGEAVRPVPRLKREQRRGMITFFVLLAAFACVLAWIYSTLFRGL